MTDPNRWQPLQIEHMISQNGIPVTNGVQQAVGPHWGHVDGFALPERRGHRDARSTPVRRRGSATRRPTRPIKDQRGRGHPADSSLLDPADGATIDISPGALGGNALGTNDGTGHPVNPATGQPYPPDVGAARATSGG